MKLYAARDKNTSKLVSNITNPSRKFWQRRKDCVNAISNANYYKKYYPDYDLELVVFELVEVEDDENENNQ